MNIITRGDFDGLVCAVLLHQVEQIDTIRFAHPQAIQQREIEVSKDDIVVNLPYHPSAGLWFDHHVSEHNRGDQPNSYKGAFGLAPSCARVIHDHYCDPLWREQKYVELLAACDKIDSGQLTLHDILRPEGWFRIANTIDPRSGFMRNEKYFLNMVEWVRVHSLRDILELDDVHEKLREYFAQAKDFETALKEDSHLEGSIIITDFRKRQNTPIGSRFLVYALYPSATVQVRIFRHADREKAVIAVGRSVINRASTLNIGELLTRFGGGGHVGAGSCQCSMNESNDVVAQIVADLR